MLSSFFAMIIPFAFGAQWQCQGEQWLQPPAMVKGRIHRVISSDCDIAQTQGRGLRHLYRYLMDMRRDVHLKQVHSGPTAEFYKGLPGVRYDVTVQYPNKTGPISVRQEVHVATDSRSRLIFDSISKDVAADGLAGNIKVMDTFLEVVPDQKSDALTYRVKISSRLDVDKPRWLPKQLALMKARDLGPDQFRNVRNRVLEPIADQL